jgi:UDP-N-acetylglucosamine transferase subunit ALG13
MIFVTIGTQGPFDRLIRAVDQTVPMFNLPVIAQVSRGGAYRVRNMQTSEFMSFSEFNSYFAKASLIVSHAGMGTIISALVMNKPILILPRLSKFREQRNDHQWATAKEFEKRRYVHTAYDEDELQEKLKALLSCELVPLHQIGKFASNDLIQSIKSDLNVSKIELVTSVKSVSQL